MRVNELVAKKLYECGININSEWSYIEYLKDIQPNPDEDYYPSHKAGEIELIKEWGNTTSWRKDNEDDEYYMGYSAPHVMDARSFFEQKDIHMTVELSLLNDVMTYQPVIIHKNSEGKYKATFGLRYHKDYEKVFNYALLKCIDIYAKTNNIDIKVFEKKNNEDENISRES